MRNIRRIVKKEKYDHTLFSLHFYYQDLCKVFKKITDPEKALVEIQGNNNLFESAVNLYYYIYPEPNGWCARISHKTKRGFLLENLQTDDYWVDGREISYNEAKYNVKNLTHEICQKLDEIERGEYMASFYGGKAIGKTLQQIRRKHERLKIKLYPLGLGAIDFSDIPSMNGKAKIKEGMRVYIEGEWDDIDRFCEEYDLL